MSLARLLVEITYTNDTKVTYNDVEEAEMILERLHKHEYIDLSDVKEIKVMNDKEETQ